MLVEYKKKYTRPLIIISTSLILIGILFYFYAHKKGGMLVPETIALVQGNSFVLDGGIGEWQATRPTYEGPLWVDQTQSGLVIAGVTKEKKVTISLKDSREFSLPEIGWGHQFANRVVRTEDDCEADTMCRDWFKAQVIYREDFKKLFERTWEITPTSQKEIYAADAYEHLNQPRLALLKPTTPSMRAAFGENKDASGYSFEVIIPWEDFPPFHALQIKDIKLSINDSVINKNFSLFTPRTYSVTSCHYETIDKLDKEYSIRGKLFSIKNEVLGYQYSPYSTTLSPAIYPDEYFEKNLDNGISLCGPKLSYVSQSKIVRSTFLISPTAEVKILEDNTILIKQGPDVGIASALGTGTCGACPVVDFDFYYIDTKKNTITKASDFVLQDIYDDEDFDYTLSSDWKTVTIYDEKIEYADNTSTSTWSSADYCFDETIHYFKACGVKNNIQAPSPRTIELHEE